MYTPKNPSNKFKKYYFTKEIRMMVKPLDGKCSHNYEGKYHLTFSKLSVKRSIPPLSRPPRLKFLFNPNTTQYIKKHIS